MKRVAGLPIPQMLWLGRVTGRRVRSRETVDVAVDDHGDAGCLGRGLRHLRLGARNGQNENQRQHGHDAAKNEARLEADVICQPSIDRRRDARDGRGQT